MACLSNRAAAWLKRKRWPEALADCNAVLRDGCALPAAPHVAMALIALLPGAGAPATS